MITFLLTVAVVAGAIAVAVRTAVRDPDQPATLRGEPRRARRPRREPVPAPTPVTVTEHPELVGGFSDQWIPVPAGLSMWVRVRSGFVLTMLLAVLGALVAVSVSGLVVLIALAVRNAVG